MKFDKWYLVDTKEHGILMLTYSHPKKLVSYLTDKIKLTVNSISEATYEDYQRLGFKI